jgi:hypothetical protein
MRRVKGREFLICFALICLTMSTARTATIAVINTNDSGPGSLRTALASATNGDTIDASSVTGTITLTSGELLITKSATVFGPGPQFLRISGNGASRVFHVSQSNIVSISGLIITNGLATGEFFAGGGGVYNDHASVTFSNCDIVGCLARAVSGASVGGGIINNGEAAGTATLVIVESTIRRNSADFGGGIENSGAGRGNATVLIIKSVLSENSAASGGYGGGIVSSGERSGNATLRIVDSTLCNNSAAIGGGIYNDGLSGSASAELTNSSLIGNVAGLWGGGISSQGSGGTANLKVMGSSLSGNSANLGGGVYNNGGTGSATAQLLSSTISGNSAGYGGGVDNNGGVNGASGGSAVLGIVNTTITGNLATGGGGILNTSGWPGSSAAVEIASCTISGNSANTGGAIYNDDAMIEIGNTILEAGGETIFNNSGTLVSLGYNLSSDGAGGDDHSTGPGGLLNATGDIRNTDPMLGLLQNNGGLTFTHALLPGSPATDQGKSFGLTADQRGFPRPIKDVCVGIGTGGGDGSDIGAFEVLQTCRSNEFKITSIKQIGSSTDLRLSYTTLLKTNYVVQARSNLLTAPVWTSLPGTNVGIGVVMQSIVTNALDAPRGFYRLEQLP